MSRPRPAGTPFSWLPWQDSHHRRIPVPRLPTGTLIFISMWSFFVELQSHVVRKKCMPFPGWRSNNNINVTGLQGCVLDCRSNPRRFHYHGFQSGFLSSISHLSKAWICNLHIRGSVQSYFTMAYIAVGKYCPISNKGPRGYIQRCPFHI